ncbi:MAG: TonB-dependent receptor [Sphingobium sp.]|nr:TonB-dependent receptor [Sphingobium sp.]
MTEHRNTTSERRRGRAHLLSAAAAIAALSCAMPAFAQDAPAAGEEAEAKDIVITGSRIVSPNFSAPTPVQAVDAAQIAANAQPNIFNTIAQLPSLQGSTGVTVGNFSTSSGTQGLSSLALRGLGTLRTLTLLDSQRVVPANVTGTPDISLFPQLLIKRVDVVNGGASASYGSDAVGGVVNFITDTRFEGIKGNIQGGISKYGDDKQVLAQLAWGTSLMDDRLHIQISGEYDHEDGIEAGGFGEQMAAGRSWYRTSTFLDSGVLTGGGGPRYTVGDHAQAFQYSKYGLITSGPLQGTVFSANGTPSTFVYGTNLAGVPGVPGKNAAGTVANCYVGFCVGGDISGNVGIGTTLQTPIERWDGYARIGYDFADNNEVYFTANVARIDTSNQPNPGAAKAGLTIQCSSPFVPAIVQQQCATAGITQFGFGTSNGQLPNILVSPTRKQYRLVGGLKGNVNFGGTDWHYDGYYQHGENLTDIKVSNITLNARYNAAIQAITLNGQVVCASQVARDSGCQPYNIIGGATPSAATLAYIEPAASPYQHTRQTQNVVSLNISGEPITLPGGPVSVAFGGEWRQEFYKVTGDPYSNGNGAASGPEAKLYPVDPLLSAGGNNWFAGNYRSGKGKYTVYEGYVELNVPLFDSESLGKANFNPAMRVTHYSTSGTVTTWKLGGTWDTPVDGLRLRGVTSRDIRAPNLSELFAAGSSVNQPNFTNPFTNPPTQVNMLQITTGNPLLTPEKARNTTFGIVYSRPSWAPGLSISFDYYSIKIKDMISTLSATQVVNFCKDGTLKDCTGLYDLSNPAGTGNFVKTQPFNFASLTTKGFDIEASYQQNNPFGLDGKLTLRALATHVIDLITNSGIPGTDPTEAAGQNSGSTPDWKVLATQTFSTDKWRFSVQERWFSDGVYNTAWIECQTGCPASTSQHPTIYDNHMKGAFYVDLSGSVTLKKGVEVYGKIDNLFNIDPVPSPQTNTGIDINPALYDVLGRMYRVGVRFNF